MPLSLTTATARVLSRGSHLIAVLRYLVRPQQTDWSDYPARITYYTGEEEETERAAS